MRSKLFVPGSRPELFAKALASAADALSFDLEDAVSEDRKAQARDALEGFLRSADTHVPGKTLIVRVNGVDSTHFAADVRAVVRNGLHVLNIPKVESEDDVHAAVKAIEEAEQVNGVTRPVRLLLNIESPRGLRRAAALACSHPRVVGLQLGLGDLFEPFGITRRDERNVYNAMFAMRLAAGEANVFAVDAAFVDVSDVEGYIAEAKMARSLGYVGKSCIHPSQVALANSVFRPSDAEITQALRVIAAARNAEAHGIGAYMVDGSMVDAPFVRRAESIVANAQAMGLVPAATVVEVL